MQGENSWSCSNNGRPRKPGSDSRQKEILTSFDGIFLIKWFLKHHHWPALLGKFFRRSMNLADFATNLYRFFKKSNLPMIFIFWWFSERTFAVVERITLRICHKNARFQRSAMEVLSCYLKNSLCVPLISSRCAILTTNLYCMCFGNKQKLCKYLTISFRICAGDWVGRLLPRRMIQACTCACRDRYRWCLDISTHHLPVHGVQKEHQALMPRQKSRQAPGMRKQNYPHGRQVSFCLIIMFVPLVDSQPWKIIYFSWTPSHELLCSKLILWNAGERELTRSIV